MGLTSIYKPKLFASEKLVIVNQTNADVILGGVIDSTKQYLLDGIIDMEDTSITVPVGGINLIGYSFDVSGITSTENNYTMFKSETALIGSGDFVGENFLITVSGTNSKVLDLTDSDSTHAFEISKINFLNCTSLGILTNYRQGLETITGRFSGSPTLTLAGEWSGGYRITTSIVRDLSVGMSSPLFKAGTGFIMTSRFLTDINCDLSVNSSFLDFSDTNFPNESTLQIEGAIITRDGIANSLDTNITPNITSKNLSCNWDNNIGIPNTFVGGTLTSTVEVLTTINTVNVLETLNATWVASDLQHFDMPTNGQLRHVGIHPREFKCSFDLVIDGGNNDTLRIEFFKYDGSHTSIYSQIRVVNNLQGARDVAYFGGAFNIFLGKNEYVYWKITNISDTTDVTLELDGQFRLEKR